MTGPDHRADRPSEDIPPRPEEDIADAVRTVDDDATGPGASGAAADTQPGRMPDYPASPRPADGPRTDPTPEIADPEYRPPDYPTEQVQSPKKDQT